MTEKPPTINDMLTESNRVRRRLEQLTQERLLMDTAFPPGPPPTRRQRIARRFTRFREQLGARIAGRDFE